MFQQNLLKIFYRDWPAMKAKSIKKQIHRCKREMSKTSPALLKRNPDMHKDKKYSITIVYSITLVSEINIQQGFNTLRFQECRKEHVLITASSSKWMVVDESRKIRNT